MKKTMNYFMALLLVSAFTFPSMEIVTAATTASVTLTANVSTALNISVNSATASLEGEGYIIKLNTLISENYIEEFKPSKNIKCNMENAEVRVKKDTKNTLKYDYKLTCTYKDKTYQKDYDKEIIKK